MAPPSILAGCELLERIASGARSLIFRSRELATGRIVAVKYVAIDNKNDYKYLRHIRNEYKILRAIQDKLDHFPPSGIVKAYRFVKKGLFRARKERALVMEYIDGVDLGRENRYPLGQIVDILTQVATSICALHAHGFIHGDIKPENIIVSYDGHATLIDFGFACRAGTIAKSIRGTRDYLAPEQLNKSYLSKKTDLYNFGATMYFLLTGRHVPAMIPPAGNNAHFIAQRKVRPRSLRQIREDIPTDLDEIVLRCVEKEPINRPYGMEAVLTTLSEVRERFVAITP